MLTELNGPVILRVTDNWEDYVQNASNVVKEDSGNVLWKEDQVYVTDPGGSDQRILPE